VSFGKIRLSASIVGSAAADERPHRAEQPHDPNNQAFDQSGSYSKSPKVADTVIEARLLPGIFN
jgi:hypothetical protein